MRKLKKLSNLEAKDQNITTETQMSKKCEAKPKKLSSQNLLMKQEFNNNIFPFEISCGVYMG